MTNRQLRRAQQQKARSTSASGSSPESHSPISEAQLDANRANILSNAIEEAVRESDANPKLFKAA